MANLGSKGAQLLQEIVAYLKDGIPCRCLEQNQHFHKNYVKISKSSPRGVAVRRRRGNASAWCPQV